MPESVIERPAVSPPVAGTGEDALREEALLQLEKKRDFHTHLLVYVLVNSFLWLIWGVVYAATGFWFPWPLFPLAGWGIGLAMHAWDVYARRPIGEHEIQGEMTRLRERG